jgi:uncharacterized protein (TIGR02145 family)
MVSVSNGVCPTGTFSGSAMVIVNQSTPAGFTLCNDPVTLTTAQPFILRGGSPLGGNYWGPGANGGFFYPNIAGPGFDTVFYTYTNAAGCPSMASTVIHVVNPLPFTCGNAVTDVRDNRQYPTVMIGNQCWMAVNLDYGSQIMASSDQRDNCIVEKYCFNDIPGLCSYYGGLYQWDELMQFCGSPGAQGLCPPGWHVPAEADWNALFNMYGNNAYAGTALKADGPSGFNALLNGARFSNMIWSFEGFATMLWSSTPIGEFKAWGQGMNTYNPSVSYYPSYRDNAFPVRCLKD